MQINIRLWPVLRKQIGWLSRGDVSSIGGKTIRNFQSSTSRRLKEVFLASGSRDLCYRMARDKILRPQFLQAAALWGFIKTRYPEIALKITLDKREVVIRQDSLPGLIGRIGKFWRETRLIADRAWQQEWDEVAAMVLAFCGPVTTRRSILDFLETSIGRWKQMYVSA